MTESSTPSVTEQPKPWAGLQYEPVRGLVERQIARYLRTQRRNMRRFFREKGYLDLAARLDEIRRDPTRNFMRKNRAFQEVLNEYMDRASPPSVAETLHQQAEGDGHVAVHATADVATAREPSALGDGTGLDPGGRVPPVADQDDRPGFVIEE
jgi:hypothetical protein